MIRTIVVDDEWYNLEEICSLVEQTGCMSVNARCRNGEEALRETVRVRPQAAFIDIEMPGMDGLTLAENLLELDPQIKIVFITGWNQYAVAAFELNALDYIMKPVNQARFEKMVQRLQNEINWIQPPQKRAIQIQCFGQYQVTADGAQVVWQRAKAQELFAFLLLNHDNFVHKDVILENLWPNCERSKSLPILQTSVCKIRNIFSSAKDEIKLTYANSQYGLFLSDVDFDLLTVENAIHGFRKNNAKTFESLETACRMFQQGLFPSSGYLWAEYYEQDMRRRLISPLSEMTEALENRPGKRLDALELLSRISPTDENAQILFLNLAGKLNMEQRIADYGIWLEQTLKNEYDADISPRTAAFFKIQKQ